MDSTPSPAAPAPATDAQKLAAEAVGTFVVIFIGVGALVAAANQGFSSPALAFGFAYLAALYAFGRISGGHFNPAVSIGAAVGGRISWRNAGLYCAAQVGGAILAGLVVLVVVLAADIGYSVGDPLAPNTFGDQGGIALFGALLVELLTAMLLVLVILGVTDDRNEHPGLAPLAIGFVAVALFSATASLTNVGGNPARSLSTVFFSGTDSILQVWLFLVGPILGGALAGLLYPVLFGRGSEAVPGSGLNFGAKQGAVPGYGAPDQFQQAWNQPGASPVYGGQPFGQQGGAGYGQAPQGGYGQPPAQQQPAAQHQPQAQPQEQPIIQDGWQWDPQAQQWIPAQQQPPQQGWGPSSESTQVRPTDGR